MEKIVAHNDNILGNFNFDSLAQCISLIHSTLQTSAANSVNRFATVRNWLFGRYIIEYEQQGNDRAQYGEKLLHRIVDKLKIKGVNTTLLKNSRKFYLTYPQLNEAIVAICPMLSDKLSAMPFLLEIDVVSEPAITKSPMSSDKFMTASDTIITRLSFSHIVELLTVDDPLIRFFYEFECIRNVWSVKELRRQISTNLHVRVGLSKSPEKIMAKLAETTKLQTTVLQLKDPVTLEFLGLGTKDYVSEDNLENSLILHLQEFMLELGKGFCFEARQKRMIIDDRYYFADLVFYNRLLHCNVLIELKNDEFKHGYLSQLNAYVSYYRENEMQPGDNPSVGILLCTRKGEKMVEYALAGMDNSLFVSTYQLCLPDKAQLQNFLKRAEQE
ncbi:MAG: PDDEXK nuclease domain-containing protein [Parabacteroides sp.]|nr:PDDEXK nuclease domain-containing protein [Parabacteroides sp.]